MIDLRLKYNLHFSSNKTIVLKCEFCSHLLPSCRNSLQNNVILAGKKKIDVIYRPVNGENVMD